MSLNLSDHSDPDEVEDPSAPWRYPRRPPFRPSVTFCCGLMLLICLIGIWIATCSRDIRLFNFESSSWKLSSDLDVDSRGYDFSFTRATPPPFTPPPLPATATCQVGFCGTGMGPKRLRHSLDWDRYQGWDHELSRAHIDHWLLITAHLGLWATLTAWQARRKRMLLREARLAIRAAAAG